MINAELFLDSAGKIVRFTVRNHGESIACAAVSMLVLNTVNSIEYLTNDDIEYEYEEEGGFLTCSLPSERTEGAGILLDAMVLGLTSVQKQYPDEIEIKEVLP